jgi:hypothetical protein
MRIGINFSIAISRQSANLAEIRAPGYHHLVGGRQSERNAWLAEFDNEDDWEELIRAPRSQSGAEEIACADQTSAERERSLPFLLSSC